MTADWRPLLAEAAARCGDDERLWAHFVNGLSEPVRRRLLEEWHWQAHGGQEPPAGFGDGMSGADHPSPNIWLLMAGRGFGKTRAGAEWLSARVRATPGARVALVGARREDAVKVMIEGPSGLLAVAATGERPRWVPTRGELELPGGGLGLVYSAEAPEALRGPEHHFAWADELAKWSPRKGEAAWDNLMMGLRLGARPRAVVTTTPKPGPLLGRLLALPGVALTGGRTADNPHLPEAFTAWAMATYGGTRLGRQELEGVLIEELEGSLFPRAMLEAARRGQGAAAGPWRRVVVGVDPPASALGDACGIIVCAEAADGVLHVLADRSVAGLRPEGWARAVAAAAEAWGADRVVAEKNNGGDMVEHVLRSADVMLPVRLVHASRGKSARAEPVAALCEAGRLKLAGRFPELEDQLAGMLAGGDYAGPGRSPDRADAMVWACKALMRRPAEPRVVSL